MADFEDKVPRPLILICGTLASKDTAAFLRAFAGLAQEVLAVPVEAEQALARTPREVAAAAAEVGIPAAACESVESALRYLAVREWRVPPRILIAGSPVSRRRGVEAERHAAGMIGRAKASHKIFDN